MKYALWIVLLLFLPVTVLVAQQSATVSLGGYNHVPPVQSPGNGTIRVISDTDTLYLDGAFENLGSAYRSASIHYGSSRESGNQLIGLQVELDEDRRGGTLHLEENQHALRPSVKEALENGELYINITSERHQNGEIRGQIPPLSNGLWREYIWEQDER